MSAISVGSSVRLREAIIEYPDGDSPGGVCGDRGDTVIVRRVDNRRCRPYLVSHADRTDGNTFCVEADEIELIVGSDK